VLVLVLVIGYRWEIDHEQDHEHDYEREPRAGWTGKIVLP
jgi:hypothetical protein